MCYTLIVICLTCVVHVHQYSIPLKYHSIVTCFSVFDYDVDLFAKYYSLTVLITDGNFMIRMPVYVTVTPLNEATPTLPEHITVRVSENLAIGSIVRTCLAEDADTGPEGDIHYENIGLF